MSRIRLHGCINLTLLNSIPSRHCSHSPSSYCACYWLAGVVNHSRNLRFLKNRMMEVVARFVRNVLNGGDVGVVLSCIVYGGC